MGSVQPVRVVLFGADGVIQHFPYSSGNGLRAQVERVLGFVPEDLDTFPREGLKRRSALVGRADLAEMLLPVLAKGGAHGIAEAFAAAWWSPIEAERSSLDLV